MTTTPNPPPPWHPEGPLPPPVGQPYPTYPPGEIYRLDTSGEPPVFPGQPYSGHVPNLGGHGAHAGQHRKRRRWWPWLLVGLAVLVFGGCMAALAGGLNELEDQAGSGAEPIANVTAKAPAPTPASQPKAPPIPPSEYQPRVEDFTLTIKVLDKQCFGEAGCNIHYRVDFKEIDPRVPDDASFEVTYTVKGGEDEAVGTIAVDGGQYSAPEEVASTKSAARKLTVAVTSVEEA